MAYRLAAEPVGAAEAEGSVMGHPTALAVSPQNEQSSPALSQRSWEYVLDFLTREEADELLAVLREQQPQEAGDKTRVSYGPQIYPIKQKEEKNSNLQWFTKAQDQKPEPPLLTVLRARLTDKYAVPFNSIQCNFHEGNSEVKEHLDPHGTICMLRVGFPREFVVASYDKRSEKEGIVLEHGSLLTFLKSTWHSMKPNPTAGACVSVIFRLVTPPLTQSDEDNPNRFKEATKEYDRLVKEFRSPKRQLLLPNVQSLDISNPPQGRKAECIMTSALATRENTSPTIVLSEPSPQLAKLGEPAEISAALVIVAEQSSLTLGDPVEMTNDQLAAIVVEGVQKLRHYLPYIRTLKDRFALGERDSANRLITPIRDCYSWKEFCDKHLDRTDRAVRKALAPLPNPKKGAQVTDAEITDFESEHPHIRESVTNMLTQGTTPEDVIGALVGMDIPEPMAEAAVRIVSGAEPESWALDEYIKATRRWAKYGIESFPLEPSENVKIVFELHPTVATKLVEYYIDSIWDGEPL